MKRKSQKCCRLLETTIKKNAVVLILASACKFTPLGKKKKSQRMASLRKSCGLGTWFIQHHTSSYLKKTKAKQNRNEASKLHDGVDWELCSSKQHGTSGVRVVATHTHDPGTSRGAMLSSNRSVGAGQPGDKVLIALHFNKSHSRGTRP